MASSNSCAQQTVEQNEPPYYAALRNGNPATAIPLLMAAICREDAHAMAILATLLALGLGVAENIQDAADWFRQSAVRGDVVGQTAYGACLGSGMGVARDDKEAAYWLYRAALTGFPAAIEILSHLVFRNQQVVGEHFSMGDFLTLLRATRRLPLA